MDEKMTVSRTEGLLSCYLGCITDTPLNNFGYINDTKIEFNPPKNVST
jgi:hypothetical protein